MNNSIRKGATYRWNIRNKKYRNFTDLGDYVIDCNPHVHFDFERALDFVNHRLDVTEFGRHGGCSALATRTRSGDVIIGRNLDLTVSQYPCFISHVKFGKYPTLNFTYDEISQNRIRYDTLLDIGCIDDEYFNAIHQFHFIYQRAQVTEIENIFISSGVRPKFQQ